MAQNIAPQKVINFPIVFHFHQPVGNFGHIIEVAYKLSYLPLIETLDNFRKVKAGLHFTGYLLEWLVDQHPEYITLLKELIDRKQVEIIGGAFYEPIIAMIPDEDKLQQIELLRDFTKEHFGVDTQGFWLAERVWEPHLPRILEEAKIKYIFIDDYHLRMNGLTEEETFYTYITEEQGARVIVVPINEPLRYITPWKPVEETIKYLSANAIAEPERLICMIDDAEKFGLWGTTNKICFKEGYDGTPWMSKLFSLVERTPWIRNITLAEYFQEFQPRGLIYMPTASYDKMSYWVLPTPERITLEKLIELAKNNKIEHSKDLLKFLRGGFWRQFLVKYYESNNMHKKMMYVREKLRWVEKEMGRDERTKKAKREIFKAQCNDPYWHGQFGGIYFGFMRQNMYGYLIEAEKIIEKLVGHKITPAILKMDFDKDGREEVLMETALINLYFHPFRGGSLFEIDHKEKSSNILNTFQRRKEAYYKDNLTYVVDRWRRYAFYDHFIGKEVGLKEIAEDNYQDLGNFLQKHYSSEVQQGENIASVRLSAEGIVRIDNKASSLAVSKFFEVLDNKKDIRITFKIENQGEEPISVYHLTDIPLYLTGDVNSITLKGDKTDSEILEPISFVGKSIQIQAKQNDIKVKISLDDPCDIYKYTLETYARTNGGYESLYQGTVLAFKKPIELKPKEAYSWKMNITLD
ncbi:MAG TPA: alpha-amylase/4-alpha-glucanotransferase domain-containing protein [Candidatus Deferrimicrobium sp.]|nr:alpha-amylase/4-alpha-glucanotransferase domain-containing protein [Candidatus Deferrimicrobium sp.]